MKDRGNVEIRRIAFDTLAKIGYVRTAEGMELYDAMWPIRDRGILLLACLRAFRDLDSSARLTDDQMKRRKELIQKLRAATREYLAEKQVPPRFVQIASKASRMRHVFPRPEDWIKEGNEALYANRLLGALHIGLSYSDGESAYAGNWYAAVLHTLFRMHEKSAGEVLEKWYLRGK